LPLISRNRAKERPEKTKPERTMDKVKSPPPQKKGGEAAIEKAAIENAEYRSMKSTDNETLKQPGHSSL
jgi:hypothetical protein